MQSITVRASYNVARSLLQICTDFLEEHADRKVTKKWVHTTVKEIAERDNGQWSINAQALADAGKRWHTETLPFCFLPFTVVTMLTYARATCLRTLPYASSGFGN